MAQEDSQGQSDGLLPHHIEMLRGRGISLETARLVGLRSISQSEVDRFAELLRERLGFAPKAPGLLIPYPVSVDGRRRFRFRADVREVTRGIEETGETERTVQIPRYMTTPGAGACAYLAHLGQVLLGDPSKDLCVVEAPLKALTLSDAGWPAIGLAGVLAGAHDPAALKGQERLSLSPEMRSIVWKGRKVTVAFDAGRVNNCMVALGEARLARLLLDAGAHVRLAAVPLTDDGLDQGPDDFLMGASKNRFQELLDTAVPACPVERARLATEATEAIALLRELPFQAALLTGGAAAQDGVAAAWKRLGIGKKAIKEAVRSFETALQAKAQDDAEEGRHALERGDHVELAERLISALEAQGKAVFAEGDIYRFKPETGLWTPVPAVELSRVVQGFAGLPVGKAGIPLKVRASDVGGVIALAQDKLARPDFFSESSGIAFTNGVLRVTAAGAELIPHSPENRVRFGYDFAFDADASTPQLNKFFADAFQGDEDAGAKTACIQEFAGAALLGLATRYQKAMVFLGTGSNAKSATQDIIATLFRPQECCAVRPQDWANEYKRAHMAPRRLNVLSELPSSDICDSEYFKGFIDGSVQNGRFPAGRPFEFTPALAHLVACNALPGTTDHSHGFYRRFIVIPFVRTFSEEEADRGIARRIATEERAGIVAWAIRGAQRLMRQGTYTQASSAKAALAAWRTNADSVARFIEEEMEPAEDISTKRMDWLGARTLYAAYREWAIENGCKAVASNSFGERMRALGKGPVRTKFGAFYPVRARSIGGVADETLDAQVSASVKRGLAQVDIPLVSDAVSSEEDEAVKRILAAGQAPAPETPAEAPPLPEGPAVVRLTHVCAFECEDGTTGTGLEFEAVDGSGWAKLETVLSPERVAAMQREMASGTPFQAVIEHRGGVAVVREAEPIREGVTPTA